MTCSWTLSGAYRSCSACRFASVSQWRMMKRANGPMTVQYRPNCGAEAGSVVTVRVSVHSGDRPVPYGRTRKPVATFP